jgi:HEPN domain-containing protein
VKSSKKVPEDWLEKYAYVMLEDLDIAARLYFESEEKPGRLMLSLYHAQQAAEKAFKLHLMLQEGLDEVHDLKKLRRSLRRLGHSPVLNTLLDLIDGASSDLTKISRSGDKHAKVVATRIDRFLSRIKTKINIIDDKDACYDKINKSLKLFYGIEIVPDIEKELLEIIKEDVNLLKYYQTQRLMLEAAVALVRKAFEPTVFSKPLTPEQLRQLARALEERITCDFVSEGVLSILNDPPEGLRDLIKTNPDVAEALRKACKDPLLMQRLLSENPKNPFRVLLPVFTLGFIQLPNGKPLLRYILNLDVFSECGRYVEPGDDSTTLDLVAERHENAKTFLICAELWVLGIYARHLLLKTIKRAAQEASKGANRTPAHQPHAPLDLKT